MELRTKLLLNKFKDDAYFKDLNDYMTEKAQENLLDYSKINYIYENLYKGFSHFIKQNIYPVGEFLSKGYSTEECEKIAELIEDASEKTVFCFEKSEIGYKFNKLFADLDFSYNTYDSLVKNGLSKDEAIENVKYELEITSESLRGTIVQLNRDDSIPITELKMKHDFYMGEMAKLQGNFKDVTKEDENLQKHFGGDTLKDRYTNIRVAVAFLGGIDLRNLSKENEKQEEIPYTKEQIKMIDSYLKMEEAIENIEYYAEMHYSEEEMAKEFGNNEEESSKKAEEEEEL